MPQPYRQPETDAVRRRLEPWVRERHVLIIGATHYVAVRMMFRILDIEPESRVTLVVRPDRIAKAEAYIGKLGDAKGRVTLLRGNEALPNFGLENREFEDLTDNVTDIYHCYGIYHVGVAKAQVEEENITAVRHSLDAARAFRRLRRFHYLSTAFICGDREGVILEDELEQGQGFRNTYERTKFTAELDVRRARTDLPVTIYRPSLIVGDSQTGEIDRLDGPYVFIQSVTRNPERLPTLLPSAGHYPFNAVPVDYVVNAMHAIGLRNSSEGRTYHLVDTSPVSEASAFRLLRRHILEGPVTASVGGTLRQRLLALPYFEKLARERRVFLNELDTLAIFNAAHTTNALAGTGITPPFFPDYVERLVKYAHRTVYRW